MKVTKKIVAAGLAVLMIVNAIFISSPASNVAADTTGTEESSGGLDLTQGLTGYYTFDGTLDNSVGTGSASLHGGAGDTWNAAATGTEAYEDGVNGQAYSFTGDVDGARGEGLELDLTTSSDFTIGMWVNTEQKLDYQPILFAVKDATNYVTAGTNYNSYASGGIVDYDDSWYWLDKNNNCSSSLTDLPLNTWVYVTLTMTDAGVATLYYNGEILSTQTIPNYTSGYFANLPIYLGINWWNESYAGLMDDVAVYNKALSANEVAALYYNDGVPAQNVAEVVVPTHVSVHDPSIIKDEKTGMYYIFGSHKAWAKSEDLIHWETFTNNINTDYETLFAKEIEWAKAGDSVYDPSGNLWAPDVIWNETMQKWCMYMSINGCSWNSSICLLTADSLDGDWTYEGTVIYSGFTTSDYVHDYSQTDYEQVTGDTSLNARYIMTAYTCTDNGVKTDPTTWNRAYGAHAIDPCVLYDNGKLYMSYGSWSGGIYMIELDETTGLRDYTSIDGYDDPYMGYHLAGGSMVSGEASYIQKIGDYYYLYVTLGALTATGGYNMRVFRSAAITGPYVDYSGDTALKQTVSYNSSVGNRVMTYYKWSYMPTGYTAEGHNSAFVDDDGKAYVIYHTRFDDGTEVHQVRVHQLFVNEDGWLVTAPFEYTGETLTTEVTKDDVVGYYEVLFHKLDIDYANLEVVEGETLSFNEDGTVSGDRTGTWEFSSKGAPYVTLTLGSTTYKGVFVWQQMENSSESTWAFTVLGSDEISVWGYQLSMDYTDEELVQLAADNLTVASKTNSDLALATEGLYGTAITWSSSNEDVLGSDGSVHAPDEDTEVTLTATISYGAASVTKTFTVLVYSSSVVYYEDFTDLSGTTGNNTGWISTNASGSVSVRSDEEHGNYLNFAVDTSTNSRGIYTDFGLSGSVTENYTVDFDVNLIMSNNQASSFVITGTDYVYSGNNINNGVTSGYILKLDAAANSTTYTVNGDSGVTVTIPSGEWVHITATVDSAGNVVANINGTTIETTVNGSGILYGMYYLRGRYTAGMSIDNIKVYLGDSESEDDDNTGTFTAVTDGTLYLDAESEVTVTFSTDGTLSAEDTVSINGTKVEAGSQIGLITVDSITYKEQEVVVKLTGAPLSGWHSVEGTYEVALLNGSSKELAKKTVQYNLDGLSENSDYLPIAITTNNEYTSGYYKIDGTKMYFMTIIKSDKIHCDGVTAGDTTYGWWNGIASELYMTINGSKYSVGSHVYLAKYANAVAWGTGTSNGSFENDLIQDNSSAVRSYMAFGTFDNDADTDMGCVLLNVVDLKDVNYTETSVQGQTFTLSGYLGPNDGGNAWVTVSESQTYAFPRNVTITATSRDTEGNVTSANLTAANLSGVLSGTSVTVEAPVVNGYNFVGWYLADPAVSAGYSGDLLCGSREYSFVAENDTDLVAVYEATGKVNITVSSPYSFAVNEESQQTEFKSYYDLGEALTVSAASDNFAYWVNGYGAIVSRNAEYTFTVVGAVDLIAVYNETATATVVFVSGYGQQIQKTTHTAIVAESDIELPDGPSKYGYTFTGWSMDSSAIAEAINTVISGGVSSVIEISAEYELESAAYTVTVNDGEGSGTYSTNDVVTVTATPSEDQTFVYWKDENNNILSYSSTYHFYAIQDVTLTAVYDESDVTQAGTATIIKTDKDGTTTSFVAMLTVPEGCTMKYAGIVATDNAATAASTDSFVADADGVRIRGDSWTGTEYQYTWTVTSGSKLYVRAYLVYTDADGSLHTVYGSDIVTNQ